MDQREKNPGQAKKKSRLGHGCLSVVSVVCCQVEVSATGWSLVQRRPTECGVSKVCVTMKPRRKRGGPGPYRDVEPYKKNAGDVLGVLDVFKMEPRNRHGSSITISFCTLLIEKT
jgi:hypothetical protein